MIRNSGRLLLIVLLLFKNDDELYLMDLLLER